MAHTPEKSRPLASKPKRIHAPRLISDHIMVSVMNGTLIQVKAPFVRSVFDYARVNGR